MWRAEHDPVPREVRSRDRPVTAREQVARISHPCLAIHPVASAPRELVEKRGELRLTQPIATLQQPIAAEERAPSIARPMQCCGAPFEQGRVQATDAEAAARERGSRRDAVRERKPA